MKQMTKICTQPEIEVISPKATLRVAHCLTVKKAGKITTPKNHYEPRPTLPPSR